jgi:hypothetical protein
MRITDLLTETVQDDRALVSIASEITQYVKENPEEFETGSSAVPVADLIDIDITDPAIEKLMSIKVEFGHTGSISTGGIYKHPSKTIKINSEFLSMQLWDRIETNLVHELRHALDDIKSAGKLYRGEYLPQYRTATDPDDSNSAPSEINARLSQAQHLMMDRIKQLPNTPSSAELNQIIFDCLDKFDLVDHFPNGTADPAFKRLVSRMYQIAKD